MWLALLILAVIACNTADDITLEAGETFTDTNVRVLKLDTFDLEFTTFKFDSVQMPLGDRILVGNYTDETFGKTSSQSFIEMIPESYDIDNEGVYDSIVLIMAYDNYYYNDTLNQMTFDVHEVTERIEPYNDETYFYNTSTLNYNENETLGSHSFMPRPMDGDSIRIKLDDEFGYNLFDQIQGNDITDLDEFRENFKGITVKSQDNTNGSVLGFSVDTEETMIRVYYRVPEDVSDIEQYFDLIISATSTPATYFNHIEADRSSTILASITNDQENLISSEDLDNAAYIQAGVGIAPRIRIPNLKSLYEIDGDGSVLNAVMKIYVNSENFSDQLFLNDSLYANTLDRHMDISEEITDYSGSSVFGTLLENSEFSEIYYSLPLTTYTDVILSSESDEDLYITLIPSEYESSVNRTILNDDETNNYTAVLELTYVIYNEED
ncbi:protein of unknown function [Pustulibacterium marinum]|uniref:DUF4270 domain-containing protein n=2 Tax=Pustulibacterium marinum TaxID=1224947 RepID=A0A1I7GPH5_9FLAO|nr:protein of unknown function [Pustulibacterium marinum]